MASTIALNVNDMNKAEERAKERFPDLILGGGKHIPIKPEILCLNEEAREVYIEGYRQAEKDFIEKAKQWFTDNIPSEKVQLLWCEFEQFITEN